MYRLKSALRLRKDGFHKMSIVSIHVINARIFLSKNVGIYYYNCHSCCHCCILEMDSIGILDILWHWLLLSDNIKPCEFCLQFDCCCAYTSQQECHSVCAFPFDFCLIAMKDLYIKGEGHAMGNSPLMGFLEDHWLLSQWFYKWLKNELKRSVYWSRTDVRVWEWLGKSWES